MGYLSVSKNTPPFRNRLHRRDHELAADGDPVRTTGPAGLPAGLPAVFRVSGGRVEQRVQLQRKRKQ